MSAFTVPARRGRGWALCAAAFLLLLSGCATNGDPRDPLEPLNRGVYKFNDGVDHLIVKPAAEVYRGVLPDFVRKGVSNVFANLNDVVIAVNNLLQGKIANAASDVGRVALNTTLGLLGIFDPATQAGLEKHNEDFGQTLGYWGLGDGPYIVLPLLGPSSLRDTVGWVGDVYAWPITYVDPDRDRNALIALRFLGQRAELLDATTILEAAALDPYEFTRDAYLQRRRNLVYDGRPPLDNDVENSTSGRPVTADASLFPEAPDAIPSAVLESAEPVATPVEIEARKPAIQPQREPASAEPRVAASSAKGTQSTRVVRVWVPARN